MSALQHLKAWWITDDPDDVARERARRDRANERLACITLLQASLQTRLTIVSRRCKDAQRRVDHYRCGWSAGGPYVEAPTDARLRCERIDLPRAS